MIRADSIKIDTDEGRYVLIVEGDGAALPRLHIDIHDIALEFYAAVRREIGPYASEAASARAAVAAGIPLDEYLGNPSADGYALDDPKHPTYYERMVD